MIFRNAVLFRLPPNFLTEDFPLQLMDHPLKPVGPAALSSRGFVSPFGGDNLCWVEEQGPYSWFTMGGEDRLLPAAVVNRELAKRTAAVEELQGRRLGGRARKRLKEEVVAELLPRAFIRPMRLDAHFDANSSVLWVNTPSQKAAENLVSEVRFALGSFPALPLHSDASVRALLTGWVAGDPLPAPLHLGSACVLADPVDSAKAKLTDHELSAEEVHMHLSSGKQVVQLELVLADRLQFTLCENLVLKKIKVLDAALEMPEEVDSFEAELCARYAIMSAEFAALWAVLAPALSLSDPYEEPLA